MLQTFGRVSTPKPDLKGCSGMSARICECVVGNLQRKKGVGLEKEISKSHYSDSGGSFFLLPIILGFL